MDKLIINKSKVEIISTQEKMVVEDPWQNLRHYTNARIALGHSGTGLPTSEWLRFSLDHARARDAVHLSFHKEKIEEKLLRMGLETVDVHSSAGNRAIYLINPDKGRRLNEESRAKLIALNAPTSDLAIVIADGLSSTAVHKQAVPLVENLLPYVKSLNLKLAPIVLAEQSRVALGDEIAQLLHAKVAAILIGERPGLSSPDSLGVYLTWDPNLNRLESERNCISNIRPEGLSYDRAAFKLAWLIESAFSLHLSGIKLKDQSDNPACYRTLHPRYKLKGSLISNPV